MTVLVSAATEQHAQRVEERARGRLRRDDVTVRWTGGDRLEHLIRTVRDQRTVLVVASEAPIVRGDGLDRLFDAIEGPLLLVR